MTTAQTSSKAKRESIFRNFMTLTTREGFAPEVAKAAIAEDLGTSVEVIAASLNRTVTGR